MSVSKLLHIAILAERRKARNCLEMFEAVCLTILLSTVRCGASVVTDGHKENVTSQSSQLGDEKVRMDTTQGNFHHKPSEDQNENSLHSESTLLVPSSNSERSEIYAPSSSVLRDVLRSNKSITDGSGTEPLQEDIGVKGLVWLRRPRDAENISSSLMARLAATMKTVGMENNELKADVKELQGTAEKLTTRLLEVEAKSSVVMEATAAQQQQQMATGQLQLQISQLVTKMLKLQDDNEALRAQLQNISEVMSAKSTKLQDENEVLRVQLQNILEVTSAKSMKLQNENEALREQLNNISEVTSITKMKLQDENSALRVQLQNISEVTSAKSTKLQNENEVLRAQLRNISEVTSITTMKLQDENAALRVQLHNISEVTSITTMKLQSENAALRVQLQNISEVTAGLQTQNRSFYAQVRTLTNDNMAQHTQAKAWHTILLEKGAALQVQASLLDSKLRVHGDELTTINKTLRTQNTELEHRLNLQISQPRNGDHDLLEKIMNYTSTEAVGFHARLSLATDIMLNGSLVLDRAEYNTRGGYNPNTGVFTVPFNGLYLFLVNIAADRRGKAAWINIVMDNTELCRAYSPPSTAIEMSSCHAATKAVKGQRVYIQAAGSSRVRGDWWTTFTGVLIQREY